MSLSLLWWSEQQGWTDHCVCHGCVFAIGVSLPTESTQTCIVYVVVFYDKAVQDWQYNLHFAFSGKDSGSQPMTRIIKRKIHRISEHIYHLIYKMLFNHLWPAFHRDYIIQLFQDNNKEKYKWSYRLWPLVVKAELCYFSSPLYSCSITRKQGTLVFRVPFYYKKEMLST